MLFNLLSYILFFSDVKLKKLTRMMKLRGTGGILQFILKGAKKKRLCYDMTLLLRKKLHLNIVNLLNNPEDN